MLARETNWVTVQCTMQRSVDIGCVWRWYVCVLYYLRISELQESMISGHKKENEVLLSGYFISASSFELVIRF